MREFDEKNLTQAVIGRQYLYSDAVFGMKESLVAQFDRHPPGVGPNGKRVETAFYTVNFDFRLRPADTAAPIT